MNDPLTVYVLPGCGQCALTSRALTDAGLSYVVVDLAIDEQAVETLKQLGYTTTPIVVAETTSWGGHQPAKIRAVASARATELYAVPVDPMDELQCDSCQ